MFPHDKKTKLKIKKGQNMKKQFYLLTVVMLTVCMSLIILGCQTAKKVTPEEAVTAQVNKFAEAMKAKNLDGVMSVVSEKFEHYEWGDKAGFREFLQQAVDVGYLDGLEIDLSKMQVKVEGATATVYPVDIRGNFGSTTVEIVFTNENGNWLVTGVDASDL